MQVNIKQNGVNLAPMEWAQAQQMLAMGTLQPTDYIWDAQTNQWVTLDHFSRQMAQYTVTQPAVAMAGGSKAAGFKWMMVTMGILCAVTAIGALVWYLASGGDDDAVAKKGDDKKKAKIAKGPNQGEPEIAGGGKRPEVPPVADDASVVISIDTQQVVEQVMGMRELTRTVLMIPGGEEILDMIRSDELTFPNDLHGVTWLARPPPVLARAGVSHVQVIYLPMDNNIAVQKVIEDSGLDAGELIEFENREHYRALVSNLSTRAMRLGFDDHAMAVVMLMDEDNDGIDLEFLEGDAEDKAREHLNDLLEKALPKDPTPPSNPRLLAFLKSPSVGGMHMNFKNLPDGMFEKAFQRPDADPGFNAFMNTVRQNLSLGMTVDVADGSATARVDIWHDKLDGSTAGRGVPEVLLNAIPAGSQAIVGLSLNSKSALEFIERELTPMLAENAVPGQPSKIDQVKAMVQLATGLSFNDLADIFKGDFVVAASGLETMTAGHPPRLIVGATIGSEQKLAILLAALNRSGALVELSKQGITLVQRPGCLFLCSNIYANALRSGTLPNRIRGAHRDLLAQNQVAVIALPQRFGHLLDTLGDDFSFFKKLREITVTSRLEKGRQSIEAKLAFRDPDMNLLQLFLERGGNLGGNRPVGNGSGFFITEDGYFITNHHVVDGGDKFKVKTPEGELAARVIKTDAKADLALLKIDSPGKFQPLPIIDSKTVSLGEQVFTIGFPKIDIQGVEPKLTPGNISSLKGFRDNPGRFQMTVPVQPGNSGGPLVNYYGNVVGVVVTQGNLQLLQNVNGAVKSGELIKFLQSVPAVRAKLRRSLPQAAKPEFTDVVKYVKTSSALVLVYRDF